MYRRMGTIVLFPMGLKVTVPSWLEPEASVMGVLHMTLCRSVQEPVLSPNPFWSLFSPFNPMSNIYFMHLFGPHSRVILCSGLCENILPTLQSC